MDASTIQWLLTGEFFMLPQGRQFLPVLGEIEAGGSMMQPLRLKSVVSAGIQAYAHSEILALALLR